jgi:peptidyl-dipeptidase A
LENELIAFEPEIDGKKYSRTDLMEILRKESDRDFRRKAWAAEEPLGERMKERVLRLINMRNEKAREMGFSGYTDFSLKTDGLSVEWLRQLNERIVKESASAVEGILSQCREKMNIEQVSEWDTRFFGREYLSRIPDSMFPRDGIVPTIEKTFTFYGYPLDKLPVKIEICDLPFGGLTITLEPGKDIRVLINPADGFNWYETMFHEMGHALHGSLIDTEYVIITHGDPGFFWEGIACVMQEIWRRPSFIATVSGASIEDAEEEIMLLKQKQNLSLAGLIANIEFELSLYERGDGDIDERYASLRKNITGIHADPSPVWAANTFNISHPVYLQNYLLSEIMASQISELFTAGNGTLDDPGFLHYIVKHLIEPGGKISWQDKLADVGIDELDPSPMLASLK